MEQDNPSLTPPNSPILQAGHFDANLITDEDRIPDLLQSSAVLLCCQGQPLNCSATHSQSLLHQGIIERLQNCEFNHVETTSHLVTLFGLQFDFDFGLIEQKDTLFALARSSFSQLENESSSAGFVQIGDHFEYMKIRQDIRSFFDYMINWLKCPRDQLVNLTFLNNLLDELMLMSVFVGHICDHPSLTLCNVASKQGNHCSSAHYHYYHLCLEVHWALIEVVYTLECLYPECSPHKIVLCQYRDGNDSSHTDATTQLIHILLWDFISLAVNIYNKISVNEYQNILPFSCSCICELTILLIKLMGIRQQKQAKQSFWTFLTLILKHLSQSESCQQQDSAIEMDSYTTVLPVDITCNNPVGFSWWYLQHITPLYCYDDLGIFSIKQKPVTSNYTLLQHLVTKSLKMNESNLRIHLRCCLTILSYWETNMNIVTQLWEYFYKKLNETFTVQTSDMMGHACIEKSALSLYENCKQFAENESHRTKSDNSFQLFLRILAYCLNASKQQNQTWRQIKGRFYSKFHVHRVEELTDVGLQNMACMFIVLGFVADATDVSAKLCDLLTSRTIPLTAARQAAVWRGLFALVHLQQHKNLTAHYITEKLATMFADVVSEFSECSDPSKASVLWNLITLYLDCTLDLIDNSTTLAYQEHRLICPSFQLLLNKAGANELKAILTFIENIINKLRSLSSAVTSQNSGVQSLAEKLWCFTYTFIKQHSTTMTPPHILADVAAGFCMLLLEPTLSGQANIKEDFLKCFLYFSGSPLVNPVISCHFLLYLLPEDAIQAKLSSVPGDVETTLIHAWFRCHWYLLTDSESLKNLTIFMAQRPVLADILRKGKDLQTSEQPTVYQFLAGLSSQYAATQELKSKMEQRERAEKYFADADRHISAVLKTCGSSSLTKHVYNIAGHMVKFCSTIIYSNTKPNCLLPVLLDRLILPRSLVIQGKELSPNVAKALQESLHLFLSGFANLDYHSDAYIKRKLKEVFKFHFTRFQATSTATMSGTHVHPFVAALSDDQTPFRQYILQMVVTDMLASKTGLSHGLQYLVELFHKSKLIIIARDTKSLLDPLLTLLIENTSHKEQLTELTSTILEANRKYTEEVKRNQLCDMIAAVIERQLPLHKGRVFKAIEGVVHSYTELFADLIPAMTGSVRLSEAKRGLGKDKQLRLAYCGLLQHLGEVGATEKTKILVSD